ncbi:MAG TPA: hypothetical protein VHF02_01215 [Luteimonas sp.]|nr:hypothetical protein [Luteimonas sp.]
MRSIQWLPGLCALFALGACQPSAPTPNALPADSGKTASQQALPTPVPAPDALASKTPPSPARNSAEHWQCGEILLDARLDGDTLHLGFSGRSLTLPHVESLTGARYADGTGNEFMRQENGAKLILAGDEGRDCSRSERTSPWIEAAARGIAFRAVGSEPGWFVEVGKGEAPPLHATLDYGDRKIEVTATHPADLGYTGTTADGTSVALKIQRTTCHDGMSGEAFEATVQLVVGDKNYRGCGAFMAD